MLIRHARAGLCLGALAILAAACSEAAPESSWSASESSSSASETITPVPQAVVSGTPYPIALQTSQTKRFLCAEFGGGSQLSADRENVGPWEKLTLLDLNGGALVSGDAINILAPDGGHFVTVQLQSPPGYPVVVTSTTAGAAERFTLVKLAGGTAGTVIQDGDPIALQASNGLYASTELGGVTGQPVDANRTAIGPWETFQLIINRSWNPQPDFVGVRDSHFFLDGQRFKHVGVNTQALLYQAPADADYNLRQMAAVGIRHVRILIANSQYTTSEIIGRLRTLLASAKAHGVKLTLTLTGNYDNHWVHYYSRDGRDGHLHPMGDDGYFTYYDPPPVDLYLYDRYWLSLSYEQNYLPFVHDVVLAFRDDPNVFAWEIAGEVKDPRYTSTSTDNEPFKRFYERMPAYIKGLDPNHLVGAGILNTIHPGLRPIDDPTCGNNLDDPRCRDALKLYRNPRIDFVTIHSYFDGGQNPADAIAAGDPRPLDKDRYPVNIDLDLARQTYKPFIIAEVGFNGSGFADPAGEMSKYYDLAYHTWDADVVMPWNVQLGDHQSGDLKYGAYEQDRDKPGQLCKYKHLWITYARELGWDNPGLVFDCGSFKDTSTMFSGGDWDYCHGKTTCAVGDTIAGLSMVPGPEGHARTALCKKGATGGYTGNVTETLINNGQDHRRAQRLGDWAYGYLKLECGAGEYVSAVSENANACQNDNKFHAIQCSAGQGLGDNCIALAFDTGDNRGSRSAFLSGDWDYGAYKGECAVFGYLAGVSVSPTTGAPHSLLCCGPSVDNGMVWGVDSANRVFRYIGGAQVWRSVPGQMAQVSVGGPSAVWAVDPSDRIFRWTGSGWTQYPGLLRQISVGHDGTTVWGVNGNSIYRYVGGAQGWAQVPGLLSQVAVGDVNRIWGVNQYKQIFRWNGSGWDLIPGALSQISVGADGTVWGVNGNSIYRYVGGAQVWEQIPGQLSQVTVGAVANVWGVNANNQIFRWNGSGWDWVPGQLRQVSAGFGY